MKERVTITIKKETLEVLNVYRLYLASQTGKLHSLSKIIELLLEEQIKKKENYEE